MIQAALVGLGWWGEQLLKASQGADGLRFIHGVSPRPEHRRALADTHGLRLSPDIATMLADPAVQAVVLATPHSLHAEQIEQVAAAGRPVLCEKPLVLTRAEAVRAVTACERAGVLLGVAHNRRFLPAVAALREAIGAGALGRLLHVEGHLSNENSSANFAPWRHDAAESPAGGMTGTGIHLLDLMVALLGPVESVTTQLVQWKPPPGALDSLAVLLRFRNGISGTLAMVRATPRVWRLHVFGTQGSAEQHDENHLVLRLSGQPHERREFPVVDTLRLELEAFAAALSGGAPYPVTPRQMLDTAAAFEAIAHSVREGGRTIMVEA